MSDRIAPRRLWLTADFTEVVLEDDPRASFLLAGKGCVIPSKVITADGPLEVVVPEEFLEPVEELVEPKASGDPTAKKERKPRAKKAKSDPDQPAPAPVDGTVDPDESDDEAAAGDPDASGDPVDDGTTPPV